MGGNAAVNYPLLRIRRVLTRIWIAVLCGTLAAQPVWSQSASPAPIQAGNPPSAETPPAPGQAAPTRLQIKVLSAVPLTEPAGALSANQVAVQVLDGWGMPVPGAAVSFRLPEAGPGGVFLNGLSTEVAIADREGKAVVKGFDWRAETGTSFLHVIAAYGEVRSGAMVEVQLGRRVSGLPPAAAVLSTTASGTRPAPKATANAGTSAFPLPAEATARQSQSASPPQDLSPATPSREAPATSQQPAGANLEAVVRAIPPAPRDLPPSRPAADYQSPEAVADAASYVTVKNKSGGGSKMLILLVVAAAAAGGALAAGVASGSSSGSNGSPTNPTTPTISIGSPSITVTGGSN